MTQAYKLYDICDVCDGTGVITETSVAGNTERVCIQCNGAKVKLVGYCSADTYDISEIPS